ncbi:hypothetical protein [Dokdonella sp.]
MAESIDPDIRERPGSSVIGTIEDGAAAALQRSATCHGLPR